MQVDDAGFARYKAELDRAVTAELLLTISCFTAVSLAMTFHFLKPED